jgi:large subunit ribosomal protein L29
MTRLVGSEMCIRDSIYTVLRERELGIRATPAAAAAPAKAEKKTKAVKAETAEETE